ncbi:hypothetical protein BLS_008959 [Venturia inaequalis]|uniref:MIT domain-containing protein n=1 Tax=Venturia inaequalis TaxID=5025 RepID=A0A8H3Z039_VENIN|nr:hypothetical protein BLS_008959 [Venturia inaequalis]
MFDSTSTPHSNPHSPTTSGSTRTKHRRHSSQPNVSYQQAGEVREGHTNPIDFESHTPSSRRSANDRPSRTAHSSNAHSNGSPSKGDSGTLKRLSARKASPPPLPPLTHYATSTSTVGAPATPGLITPGGGTGTGPDYFSPPSVSITSHSPNHSPISVRSLGFNPPARGDTSPKPTKDRVGREYSLGGEDIMSAKRHSISRSQDATAENRRPIETEGSDAARQKDRREQDKKSMLSKALQKAHTAVLLDNAQNFEGAIEAYSDACRLLQHVLQRSTGEEDRRKLDAIRTTYTNRITELRQLHVDSQATTGKSLPRPPSSASQPTMSMSITGDASEEEDAEDEDYEEEAVIIETATSTRITPDKPPEVESNDATQRPPDAPSLSAQALQAGPPLKLQDSLDAVPKLSERFLSIESPMDASYAPPPLSPRRVPAGSSVPHVSEQLQLPRHARGDSGNSISWLDTIDESGGSSCGSSIRSRPREILFRKHARIPSGDTEAEFDAALDAAVEAAYDDGFEPYDYDEKPFRFNDNLVPEPVKVMVDDERKRLSDREQLIQAAHSRAHELRKNEDLFASEHDSDGIYDDDDAEEEERLLDEMSKDFGFDFGLQSKAAPPRTSDSSVYSGNTWHSSVSSNRTTALSSLSTVTEAPDAGLAAAKANANLPRLSEEGNQNETLLSDSVFTPQQNQAPSSVRSRRMSGQNAQQLKIETSINPISRRPLMRPSDVKADSVDVTQPAARSDLQLLPDTVFKPPGSAPNFAAPQYNGAQSSPHLAPSPEVTAPTASPATLAVLSPAGLPLVPTDTEPLKAEAKSLGPPGPLRKNKSSISLNTRQLTMSSPDGSDEASIGTPLSTTFSAFSTHSRKAIVRPIDAKPPTPSIVHSFGDAPGTTTNISIFESDIHSPFVPGSPNPLAANAPIPLEACPDSHLLRPFWLMRCFYQTIAHPRGGYLSTKLFVPRDVWRVKGVKIKGVEDKIANCDLLTAALQKLSSVDTLDADAVLDEMQSLEHVLDQVQGNLIKKLSSEVGVQGIASLFKDAPNSGGDGIHSSEPISASSRAVSQGKSYLSSWRKLRSKSSAVNMTSSYSSPKDHAKETITLSTLPMTSLPNPRFTKRDVSQLELSGPHAAYMGSLSRLFDAVQIVDQVARQVEDPGLKLSSPTHVGLELCTRHASEFFGFYICRFVLTDLTMLLDKFIKRGSEWVLV